MELRYTQVQLEYEYQVLVQWINQGQCSLWYLWDELKLLLQQISLKIEHVYREANLIADCLAKLGTTGVELKVTEVKDLPWKARGAYRLDLDYFPSICFADLLLRELKAFLLLRFSSATNEVLFNKVLRFFKKKKKQVSS